MRSADCEAWESAALPEHNLDGAAVWRGVCYMASLSDGAIYTMDAFGKTSAFATWEDIGFPAMPAAYFCLFDLGTDGLLCIACIGDTYLCALYDGSVWNVCKTHDQFSSPRRKIVYQAPFLYGIENGRLFYQDIRKLTSHGLLSTEFEVYDIAARDDELYAVASEGISRVDCVNDSVALIPVCEQPWKGRVCHLFFDALGCVVVCNNRTFISRDLMQSWMGCETPFIDDYNGLLIVFGNIVLATGRDPGAELPPRSAWCVWDRRHIWSARPASITGCILDGQDVAVCDGQVTLRDCRVTGYIQA